jgi:hypothetical protein
MFRAVTRLGLLVALGVSATACLALDKPNRPPIAVVTVEGMDAKVVAQDAASSLLTLMVPPGDLALNGSTSADPDGDPITLEWWNTGTPRAERFPIGGASGGAGAGGAPALPPVDVGTLPKGPDGTGPTFTARLPAAGTYYYSLQAKDDKGNISVPATIKFVVQ